LQGLSLDSGYPRYGLVCGRGQQIPCGNDSKKSKSKSESKNKSESKTKSKSESDGEESGNRIIEGKARTLGMAIVISAPNLLKIKRPRGR